MHRRQFTGLARAMRGAALGSVLFALTVSGHMASGGGHSLANAVWLLPIMIVLSATLADRRRTLGWLVAYLLGAETLFHLVLTVSLGHDGRVASAAPSPAMVVAHAVAAVVAAVAIHHADDLLHRWLQFVETLTHGPRLQIRSLPSSEAALPTSSGFAISAPDVWRWQALRAPPVVPA